MKYPSWPLADLNMNFVFMYMFNVWANSPENDQKIQ